MKRIYSELVEPILFSLICIFLIPAAFAKADASNKDIQLIQAAKDSNLSVVQTLLADGADVNAKDNNGLTALWMAAQNGHAEVVKLLLQKGADVNAKRTSDVATALMVAVWEGHTEVVKLLLDKGADVNAKAIINNVEWTALKLAKKMGHTDIVQLLEKATKETSEQPRKIGIGPVWTGIVLELYPSPKDDEEGKKFMELYTLYEKQNNHREISDQEYFSMGPSGEYGKDSNGFSAKITDVRVRFGAPDQVVKDKVHSRGDRYDRYYYGPIILLTDPNQTQIKFIEVPVGFWRYGIRRKAQEAIQTLSVPAPSTEPQSSNLAELNNVAVPEADIKAMSRLFRTPLWEIKIESFRWVEFVHMDISSSSSNNEIKRGDDSLTLGVISSSSSSSSNNIDYKKFTMASPYPYSVTPREGFRFLALLCTFDARENTAVQTQPEKDILLSYSRQSCELLGLFLCDAGNIKPTEQGYATTKFEAIFVVPKSASSDDVTIRVQNSNAPAFTLNCIAEIKDGKFIEYDRKKSAQPQGLTKEPEPQHEKKAKNLLPAFKEELQGSNPVRVKNPNSFAVATGLRSGGRGKNFDVPANGVETVYVPDGKYDIYFVYSDKPDALFQGDSFTLNNDGVEIQIVQVVNGNYNIRQVK